ncbi:GNAT family N-acetyltransferase [Paenibacillus daejeonensis]|uniref:GNAT family N-acetyltransferase n=1 Tax=Paenibacillus daejeonensis TaxID=135193 RepID=UPI00036D3358|nr:GNAT family N-acetyltransferase [Paenibacillus daejeonensis]
MELRNITADEVEASLELAMYAFQFKLDENELEQAKARVNVEEVWGVFEEGQLIAQLTLLPLQTYIGGKSLAMGGIAGVSTWPEHRRQGAVAQLMVHSLKHMRNQGQTISFLTPFAFQFYRRYGWEMYVEYKAYTIETELLPPRSPVDGTVKRYSELNQSLVDRIAPVYERYASRYNGTLARSGDWWFQSIFKRNQGYVAVYTDAENQITGYLFYKIDNREFIVHEMVYLTPEARQGLWNFISNHDSMIERVQLKAPSDDSLSYLLSNPRFEQKLIPYFMGRIVDVESFLTTYPFAPTVEQGNVTIAVTDEYAPWNEGVYQIEFNENGHAVTKYNQPNAVEAQISCSIQSLSAMMIGFKRPLELRELMQLQGDHQAIQFLEACISAKTTYLMDFF